MNFDEFLARPVGDILDHFGIEVQDVTFYDEPPCKLCGIRFWIGVEAERKEVWAGIRYRPELFSLHRQWTDEAVRCATIIYAGWRPWWNPESRSQT